MTCRHIPAEIIKKRGVSVKKRILSILLAALMLLSALPLGMVDTAYAAETSGVAAQSYYVAGGQCGDDLTWTLDSSGTLTISGTGPMYGYSLHKNPWCDSALRNSGISTRVKNVEISSGVTTLGAYALSACDSMVSVSLPETLLAVGESCFFSSTALHNISIPNSVRSIGDCAFSGCNGLTRVTLGSSLKGIGGQAFKECSSLSSIVIPEGVTAIEYSTFEDCSNLMEITIPRTVTSIGRWAFDGCYGLSKVTFTGTRAQWNAIDVKEYNDPLLSANITFAGSGPAAPTVTGGNDSQGRPTLKWNAVSGAAKYEVYRARSLNGDYIKYSTTTGTAYTNTSYIENGNTYYYKVRALKSDGTAGAWSSIVSVTYRAASAGTLSAPSVTGGNDSQGRPTLKWNAVTGAAKYEVYRARSKDGDYIKYSTVTGTSYTNTSYIENGNTYYYKVRALDANGTAGAWSSIVSVTYKQTLPAPTVTGGNDAQGRPTLKWKAVTGAAKYEVYRARSKDGDYIKYSTVTGTSYTNTSYIEDGNTYYYKVRALDANGTAGAWSSIVSVTYKQTLPAPAVTGGNDSQGRPTLKWNAVSGAAKYEVYRARSKDGDYIKYSTVTGTSYTNTSYIENGNTYYYKVRALGSDGTAGAWSSVVSVTYKQTLSAPTVTGGNDAQGRPTLKWDKVAGAAKYEVYRARSQNGDYIKYSTVTGTSYTNTSYIESGSTYYYKVRALDANGTAGAWSSIVAVTYKQTLSAPSVTGGNDSQGRPTLKWNTVTGAAKYEVYRARSKDGDYIKYSTVTGTSYTNTSYIEDGNTYYYKVRALDANGTAGAWSSIVAVTYQPKQTLSAPTVTGGNDSQGRPTLKWNAVSGAAKYEVYRARSKDGDYIKYSTVTGTSYTNTSYIENGNTYYYKMRALKSDGTAGAWSSVVSVTYKQTLPAPAVTGGNDAQGRPTLKWNAVTGAAKYEVYRARSKDGTYTKYSTTTGTAYTNSSYLTSGATYYYKVRALDANGNAGPYSAVVSVTCRLKLTAPSVTGGTDAQGRPTLKWNAVSGAAKYEVYRARSMNGDYIKYSTVTGTSYTNTSYLANGTTYYYKVRALGSDGSYGPYSTPVSVTYKAPFGAPLVTGSKDSQGRPALKWDKVTDAAKYEVYRARSKDGTYSLMSTQSATGYTNTSYLANGTTYYYKVRALKANGTASAYSSVVTITYGTVPAPAAPAMRSAKADSAGITVSWDTAANAVTYNVYRTADAGSSWTQVASSVKGSSYKDTTVQKGVKYGYKVRGVAADGKTLGPMSPTGVTAKVTAASTTPDYVKLTSARRVTGGIQLTWESAADAKTYNVYRKVDGASGWTLLASSVSGTTYKDTSGKSGTTYAYTVRGVAADGKTLSRTYNTDGLRATMP